MTGLALWIAYLISENDVVAWLAVALVATTAAIGAPPLAARREPYGTDNPAGRSIIHSHDRSSQDTDYWPERAHPADACSRGIGRLTGGMEERYALSPATKLGNRAAAR